METNSDAESVRENYRRLLEAIGCVGACVVTVRQVHGGTCVSAAAAGAAADAITTDQPATVLSVRVADCVPILLADRQQRAVAAVHAGWRGIVAGVVPSAVTALRQRHAVGPSDLVAAIGPCLSVAHFEVGPEVAAAFHTVGLGTTIYDNLGPKPHIDMAAAVRQQLRAAGIPDDAIDTTDRCTYRDAADFFSHRRDAGRTGRMAAVIALPG